MAETTFDSIEVGDTIPSLETERISRTTLALFAGASGDHNPIHIDIDVARSVGLDDVFAHGMLSMAYLGRMLTDWAPQSALKSFQVRFTSITKVHDLISCTGLVIGKSAVDGEKLVRLEVQAADQVGDVKLAGEAVLALG